MRPRPNGRGLRSDVLTSRRYRLTGYDLTVSNSFFRVKLELALAIAEELGKSDRRSDGVKAILELRRRHPDENAAIQVERLRYVFRHWSPDVTAELLDEVRGEINEDFSKSLEIALRLLGGFSVSPDEETRLIRDAEEDWLWHIALGEKYWSTGDKELAWWHWDKYILCSKKDSQESGWPFTVAEKMSAFERPCQACGDFPGESEFYARKAARHVRVCKGCAMLAKDESFLEAIRSKTVPPANSSVAAVCRITEVFKLDGRSKASRFRMRPIATPLRYHDVSTLEKRLDAEAKGLLENARVLAESQGLDDANSLSLLAEYAYSQATETWYSSWAESLRSLADPAKSQIPSDPVESLREVLNIAGWSAILEERTTKIGVCHIGRGLIHTVKGMSRKLMLTLPAFVAHSQQRMYIVDRHTRHSADLERLYRRHGVPFLELALHSGRAGHLKPNFYLQYLDEKRDCIPPPSLHEVPPEQRVKFLTWWARELSEESEWDLYHLENLCSVTYPPLERAVAVCLVERFPQHNHHLLTFASYASGKPDKRHDLTSLSLLTKLRGQSRYQFDRVQIDMAHLQLLTQLKRYDDALELCKSMLEALHPGKPEDDHFRYRCLATAVCCCYSLKDFSRAASLLNQFNWAVWSSNLVHLARPLWENGFWKEFREALKHFETLPNADRTYLRETLALYEELQGNWSAEDMMMLNGLTPLGIAREERVVNGG